MLRGHMRQGFPYWVDWGCHPLYPKNWLVPPLFPPGFGYFGHLSVSQPHLGNPVRGAFYFQNVPKSISLRHFICIDTTSGSWI